jgi:hypothetical protein
MESNYVYNELVDTIDEHENDFNSIAKPMLI